MMTLDEFAQLTRHLPRDTELLCGGAPVETMYSLDGVVSIDDDCLDLSNGEVVLFESV